MNINISTERFVLRSLTVRDVGENYLKWFLNRDTSRFIVSSSDMDSLERLKSYVRDRENKSNVLFLGIFINGTHIGNIKFEPLDIISGYGVLGVLLGEVEWRGKGVLREVLSALFPVLREKGLKEISLAVENENFAAIRAYEKIGFIKRKKYLLDLKEEKSFEMIFDLQQRL